jgi:hypothetical protein
MRLGVSNGNGCTCDVCHTALNPEEAIKLKSYILDTSIPNNSGQYKVLQVADMCPKCYGIKLSEIMRDSTRKTLRGVNK